ncbi:MAG TPA: hemerythrin domain-containing protein [Ilumatobacteraceae bacterium]|nr:hemerythrin domain-containing protein [Ilumatobacteraceae bacterium]HRB03887.1 hemerythrin domain-containing protein [Ilumatobacteraceae bacterium]
MTPDHGLAEWSTMSADALVDDIVATHHRYLWDELPRTAGLVDTLVIVHGERHPELVGIALCFSQVQSDLEAHMSKEEHVLFPMIRELATSCGPVSLHCGSLRNPISVMLSEHGAVDGLFAKLRLLTSGYTPPSDSCPSYIECFAAMAGIEADIYLHMHKEDDILFPLVVRLEAERVAVEV